jgi:RNA polymerase sigma-70 factor (ECF subfamily)
MTATALRSDPLASTPEEDLNARLDRAAPSVLAWCRRLGGPKVDADDAAQDVLLTAWRRLDTLQDEGAFDAWLYGITRRVLAAHRRRAWVRRWTPGATPEAIDPGRGPRAEAELSEIAAEVQRILEQLPADQREVLVLSDVEERSDSEVAALLDLPTGTVKSRLRLARGRFRRLADRRRDLLLPGLAHAPSWGQG